MPIKKRILLVDDDRSIVRILQLVLSHEGHDILIAYDGPEALHIAYQERPDLVLLDVEMPSMDGYEVCRRLRARPETAGIPVVMLTVKGRLSGLEPDGLHSKKILHTRVQERAKGFDAGAVEFLSKPIIASAVVEAVHRVLQMDDLSGP